MYPARSIIFFTVVSGLGYGMAAFVALGIISTSKPSGQLALLLAICMISAGLFSSTFHLKHPERAWRALTQWRSSWLSREGVVAVITFVPLCLLALESLFGFGGFPYLGICVALLAMITIYCTSMIYASLKTVHAWHHWLTSMTFLLFALAGGLLLSSIFVAIQGGVYNLEIFIVLLLALAWGTKLLWWKRLDNTSSASNPQSATGLGEFGKVRVLERPHIEENYLTHEMGFKVARKHAAKMRKIAGFLGLVIPVILVILGMQVGSTFELILAVLATISFCASLFVERWLFFAEAKHSVMLFYGESTA